MPRLACQKCGRQIYTVSPLESLFAEERRCPRCGAFLSPERRDHERRYMHRRQNPNDDPGSPGARERRMAQRRAARRRAAAA
jgi:ribosomal protein S27AE